MCMYDAVTELCVEGFDPGSLYNECIIEFCPGQTPFNTTRGMLLLNQKNQGDMLSFVLIIATHADDR